MAGNQVLEWTDLDTEIKTAGLKDVNENRDLSNVSLAHPLVQDPLAPPDLYDICILRKKFLGSSITTFFTD